MTPKLLYRMAAILLVVFAALHTIGFTQIDPLWGIDNLIAQLRGASFQVQGQTRSYWDFYLGAGYSLTVWKLLAAGAAWQLGGLAPATLLQLPILRWGLALTMTITAVISWRYLFPAPLVLAGLVTACLSLASWRVQATARVAGR